MVSFLQKQGTIAARASHGSHVAEARSSVSIDSLVLSVHGSSFPVLGLCFQSVGRHLPTAVISSPDSSDISTASVAICLAVFHSICVD